jgi:hypothetical protein
MTGSSSLDLMASRLDLIESATVVASRTRSGGLQLQDVFGHGVGATWRAAALQPWCRGEANSARRVAVAMTVA